MITFGVVILVFTLSLSEDVCGYKILLYNPRFAGSHTIFAGKIADVLAAAGHEVVVYQPLIDPEMADSGSKNTSVRFVELEGLDFNPSLTEKNHETLWEDDNFDKLGEMLRMIEGVHLKYCAHVMNDFRNHQLLKNEKFDLGIIEVFASCGLGVFERIGLDKYIATHSSGMYSAVSMYAGAPRVPAISPAVVTSFTDQMNFGQRVVNFLGIFVENHVWGRIFTDAAETAIRKHFPDFDMTDKILNAAFFFVNSDEHVDYTLPITSKVVHIGGMGKPVQARALEQRYAEIFDSSDAGVVFISFGSTAQSAHMPQNLKDAFLSMFAEFPDINFIWKYEDESHQIAKGLKNVFTSDWLPQNEILSHPKLIGFVTHGGMNSVTESSTIGVPRLF